jgi:hypothetical protein
MRSVWAILVAVVVLSGGCRDMGNDLPVSPRTVILAVLPDSGRSGDTVTVAGTGFGASRADGVVRFGSVEAVDYPSWSDTAITLVIPADAPSGTIAVVVGGEQSNAIAFRVLGAVVITRSFSLDVLPILNDYGCTGCHGGSGGLFVGTPGQLLQGGAHGPAVIPGDADGSLLIQKLAVTTPFGDRMPAGGPYLPEPVTQIIKDWINEGAHEN